jgi:putative transposase
VKYVWIHEQRGSYPVAKLCELLSVSKSGYHAWKNRPPSVRELENGRLETHIRAIHAESGGTYGSPRVHRELIEQGNVVSLNRVRRLMKKNAIRARHKRRWKATTDSNHNLPVAPNLLEQRFEAERPNQVWLADISYIWTDQGWLYLACILGLYSRLIVGWAMSHRPDRKLVLEALGMAYFRRRPPPGLLHHSDRGSQYCSHDYQQLLQLYGITASMSRKGNCYDNAPMESFFHSLKVERIHDRRYATRDEAHSDVFNYVETFYNPLRRHSALDYRSPREFERRQTRKEAA